MKILSLKAVSPPQPAHRGGAAHTRSRRLIATACLVTLALAAALVWCWHYQRWNAGSWGLPTDYSGDSFETLARLKAAAEGDIMPLAPQVIDRLGAPFGAFWNAYPTPDKPLMLLLGLLARGIGLYAAANAGLLLAQVSAALSFCLVARWLRCRWEWAMAGGLLFAYTASAFPRGLAHFSLVFSWTVPLGLLAVWLVAGSRRLEWRSGGAVVCLGAALALGLHNPYNLFFWLQLMGWALVAQWFGGRRRVNLQIGLAALALALAAFFAVHIERWAYIQEPAGASLFERNYGGTERYALKPVELFIPPPTHRWEPFAFLGGRYNRWSEWRGETFLPYLGVVGIAGLAWLAGVSLRRIFARRPLPGAALTLGWLLAFATIGGITNLLAFFAGLQVFRATNRVGVFLSAILICFLVNRLSRVFHGRAAGWSVAAAILLALVGVLDEVPRAPQPDRLRQIASMVASDQELGRQLEAALPAGAMVFQLPVMGFPEELPPGRMFDYEHFRLYFATETLRFSYGAVKLRARSRWQRDLANAGAAELVRRLEDHGFAALCLNRRGYEDQAEQLLQELERLGYHRRIAGALGHQVVVLLHPSSSPRPPLAVHPTYGRGWYPPQASREARWAFADATLSYFNPLPGPLVVEMQLTLSAPGQRRLTLTQEGRPLQSIEAWPDPRMLRVPGVVLHPGVNHFRVESSEAPARLDGGRYALRAFAMHEAQVISR